MISAETKKDLADRVEWYFRAAHRGIATAQNALGLAYCFGAGITKNVHEGIAWLEKAANQGNDSALYNLGGIYFHGVEGIPKDLQRAICLFEKASALGNVRAKNDLAYAYYHGLGVERNPSAAVELLWDAVRGGAGDSAFNHLGQAYEDGNGVEQDLDKAVDCYKKAADLGSDQGLYNLGRLHFLGKGLEKNFVQAVEYYRKASGMGNDCALRGLGDCYFHGRGVPIDYKQAFGYYQKAAIGGDKIAQNNVGVMYHNGQGVDLNDEQAKKWLQKAAQGGLRKAQSHLREWFGSEITSVTCVTQEGDWERELDALVGLSSVKKEIRSLAAYARICQERCAVGLKESSLTNHCIFVGNPGTGKTTVARILSKIYHSIGILKTDKLVETSRSDLVGRYIGETAPKTNRVIDSALDGVLFIDEAYMLAGGGDRDFGKEALDTLVKRMEDDRSRLVVVMAGYPDEMRRLINMNPGLRSRFPHEIVFPDYTGDELFEIFCRMISADQYVLDSCAKDEARRLMNHIAEENDKSAGNGRAVRNFYESIIRRQSERLSMISGKPTVRQLQTIVLDDISDDGIREREIQGVLQTIDSLIGLAPIKKEIYKLVDYIKVQQQRREQKLKTIGLSYHYVFSGNPGTGKTTIARAIGKIYHALGILKTDKFIEVNRSALVAGYVGQTALKTNDVIDSALDGVLFIDEAYTLTADNDEFGREALCTLLTRMENDRARLVVIVAGYRDEMEKFISANPGLRSRFTRYMDFPDYGVDELTAIFEKMVKDNQYVCEAGAMDVFEVEIAKAHKKHDRESGNGRFVRSIFERALERQAVRISKKRSNDIMALTKEDIRLAFE